MAGKRSAISDFDVFVKAQQTGPEDAANWAHDLEEWLRCLDELYKRISSYLSRYIKSGEIKQTFREVMLNEENIGSYAARQMILRIGRQEVTLTPVGTMLVGMKGRVDVVGSAGETRFVLVNSEAYGIRVAWGNPRRPGASTPEAPPKETKWAWKIETRPPAIRYVELTPQSLFDVLIEVSNG